MTFAEAVGPRLDGGSCPHMAVVLRSGRELPAVLVSFYALGARRGGWVVHHALPGQCDRDRERLTAGGHSALWYSRFPIGPGAVDFANATAYDRAWDARFRGRPVVTLCPYVLAGEDAGERIAHLNGWHDAVLDADGRVMRSATQSKPT